MLTEEHNPSAFSSELVGTYDASDLFEEVFGESGKHARAAVSVAGLPRNATAEIQVTVELHAD